MPFEGTNWFSSGENLAIWLHSRIGKLQIPGCLNFPVALFRRSCRSIPLSLIIPEISTCCPEINTLYNFVYSGSVTNLLASARSVKVICTLKLLHFLISPTDLYTLWSESAIWMTLIGVSLCPKNTLYGPAIHLGYMRIFFFLFALGANCWSIVFAMFIF
uniref:(northern house mosquito) hypothetical protein n=1 Tax=Culex pipiens TaxID=7175 RepID=A0A8D8JG01_CULPI